MSTGRACVYNGVDTVRAELDDQHVINRLSRKLHTQPYGNCGSSSDHAKKLSSDHDWPGIIDGNKIITMLALRPSVHKDP